MKKFIFSAKTSLSAAKRKSLAYTTTDPKLLYRLAFDPADSVVIAVAGNKSTPAGALRLICERATDDLFNDVVRRVAGNQNCDASVIKYLLVDRAQDLPTWGTGGLIDRCASQHDLSEIAITSSRSLIKDQLATKVEFPDILGKLAYDASWSVRNNVAANKATPPEILEVLCYDPEYYVQQNAIKNPNTPADTVVQSIEFLDTPSLLEVLYSAPEGRFSSQFVIEQMRRLFSDPDRTSRDFVHIDYRLSGIVRKYKLPTDLLLRIVDVVGDSFPNVISAIAKAPYKISSAVVNKILSQSMTTLAALLKDNSLLSLIPKCTDSSCLGTLYRAFYSSKEVCRALAANSHTPKDVLQTLSNSEDRLTRIAATNTLGTELDEDLDVAGSDWSISPYELTSYAYINRELGLILPKVMAKVAKDLGRGVSYEFDSDTYDDATELTITTDDGESVVLDAQRFLASLTAVPGRRAGINKASAYIEQMLPGRNLL